VVKRQRNMFTESGSTGSKNGTDRKFRVSQVLGRGKAHEGKKKQAGGRDASTKPNTPSSNLTGIQDCNRRQKVWD